MSEEKHCSKCGKPVPGESPRGVCPACLMEQAMASRTLVTGQPDADLPPPPTPGEIADKFPQYEVVECLGRGGMGVVYKARQKSLNRLVAIKILAPERVGEGRFAERFTIEAELLAKLGHPHIVTIHDFGETGGLFYLVMEFIDGVNLRDLLRDGKLESQQALAIVPPICDALQYAHDKGIVHRDIKPENILLDRDGRVKIADFGIASLVGATGENSGTPPYMAPEQSGGTVDRRADIYALGVVLYEMLTGERPEKNLMAPSSKVQLDVKIDEIVLRALEKEPERRYQTAGEFGTVVQTKAATPANSVQPDISADDTRFSRTAIVGACWASFAFIALFLATIQIGPSSNPPTGRAWWQWFLIFTVLPLGITAPFGTTILGWVAVSKIRRSAGRIQGLGLAVFDGLLFPLLALTGLIAGFWHWVFSGLIRDSIIAGGPELTTLQRLFVSNANAFTVLATLLTSLVVSFLIIRRVWRAVTNSRQHPGVDSPTDGAGKAVGGRSGPAGGLSGIWSHAVVLNIGYLLLSHGLFLTGQQLRGIELSDGDFRVPMLIILRSLTQGMFPVGVALAGSFLSIFILIMLGRGFGKLGLWIGSFVGGLPIFVVGIPVVLMIFQRAWWMPGFPSILGSLWLASAWVTLGFLSLRKAAKTSTAAAWCSVGLAAGVVLVILLYMLAEPTRKSANLAVLIIALMLGLASLACGIASWRTRLGRGMVLGWATCAVVALAVSLFLHWRFYSDARSLLAREQAETSYGEAAGKLYESEESDSSDELSTPSGNESVPPLRVTGPTEEFTQDLLRGWVENRWKTEYPHETFVPLEWGVPKAVAPHDWVTIRCKYRYTPPWTGKTRIEERYITFTKTGDFVRSDIVEEGAIKVEEPAVQTSIARLVLSKERGGQISPDGVTYSLDGEVVAMENLQGRFQQMVKERPELQVVVHANDPELPAGRAIAAIQTARAAGVKHVRVSNGEPLGEEPTDADRGADGAVTKLKIKQPDGSEEVGSLQPEGIDLLREVLSREPDHVVPADRRPPLEPRILLEWQGNKYAVQSDMIVLIGARDWTMWLSPGIDEKLTGHSDVRVIQGTVAIGSSNIRYHSISKIIAGAVGFLLLTVLGFLTHRRLNPDRRLEITALFLCVAGVILPLLILVGHLFGIEQAVVALVAFVLFAVMQLTALILGIIRFSEPLGRAAAIASGILLLGSILFLS